MYTSATFRETALAALCCAVLLTACSGSRGGPAHPAGWTQRAQGQPTVWIDPNDPSEEYRVTSRPNSSGTLSDMASQVTTDTLLRYKGAELRKAVPFGPCPGEAGIQTFSLPAATGTLTLQVAFTQWNGTAVTAAYQRPASAADDPAALEAMRRSVCSPTIGG